jgi:hypothetical protein
MEAGCCAVEALEGVVAVPVCDVAVQATKTVPKANATNAVHPRGVLALFRRFIGRDLVANATTSTPAGFSRSDMASEESASATAAR